MHLDGVFADVQLFGNVSVGQALVQHQDQLLLTLGQFGRSSRCGGVFSGGIFFADQQTTQSRNDLCRAVGFFNEHIGPGFHAPLFKFAGAGAGHNCQRHIGEFGLQDLNARHAQSVRQLKVKAKELGGTVLLHRGLDHVQLVDGDDLQAGFDPVNQHGQRIAHQGMVVNDVNSHVLFSALALKYKSISISGFTP